MRILICSLEAPLPPTNGLRLQVAALREQLSRRHDVRVLAFRMPDQSANGAEQPGMRLLEPPPEARALRKLQANLRSLLTRRPRGFDEIARSLRGPLTEELERFRPDVVHTTMAQVDAVWDGPAGPATVLAALDAWHVNYEAEALAATGARKWLLRSDISRVRRLEAREFRRFGRVVVVTDHDADALREVDPGLALTVIPNGVDATRFAPPPFHAREPNLIVFTGVMSYGPNVTAAEFLARRLMPRVRAVVPDARLALVGRAPPARVRALARMDGVEVVGEVPDMNVWLGRGRLYVCPILSGTGIRNKLLEAFANGLPCVATARAVAGLQVQDRRHFLAGADEEELAGHAVRLLRDAEASRALGAAAREYVLAEHSWEAVARAYEQVYDEVLSALPSSAVRSELRTPAGSDRAAAAAPSVAAPRTPRGTARVSRPGSRVLKRDL
jgi:glycosyltransferase involved in cell wall biosynthesis